VALPLEMWSETSRIMVCAASNVLGLHWVDAMLILWAAIISQLTWRLTLGQFAYICIKPRDRRACLTGPDTCLGPSNNPTSSMAVNEFFILYYFLDFFQKYMTGFKILQSSTTMVIAHGV
jgi:hypothetical protein